jgi:hypothetical protein
MHRCKVAVRADPKNKTAWKNLLLLMQRNEGGDGEELAFQGDPRLLDSTDIEMTRAQLVAKLEEKMHEEGTGKKDNISLSHLWNDLCVVDGGMVKMLDGTVQEVSANQCNRNAKAAWERHQCVWYTRDYCNREIGRLILQRSGECCIDTNTGAACGKKLEVIEKEGRTLDSVRDLIRLGGKGGEDHVSITMQKARGDVIRYPRNPSNWERLGDVIVMNKPLKRVKIRHKTYDFLDCYRMAVDLYTPARRRLGRVDRGTPHDPNK